jgi:7,8-dihydropterin-6-yl-methyl-4-(beta-D-ribofuranosyl)aminobenzene 5'-phosphate synthase
LEFARQTFKVGEDAYGVYGGLHISPFEAWDPSYDDLVLALSGYGLRQLACNHCTGLLTAQRMVEQGLPVVRGTARHKSASDVYLGNGDEIIF